ncbi:hypothetical protein [Acidiferrobacter sp.]|uniref:hypothetical protein n=1 Tax=Acidiferrobacter sp. TaxID=1872107 RepID=UPI0026311DF3|nr:hypothetical protein [Acidiferrobacter sp.]
MTYDPSNAVVHLTLRYNLTDLAVGSGVLYRKNDKTYIVTAWHNVTGRDSTSLKPLSKTAACPNSLVAYVACRHFNRDGAFYGYSRLPFTVPLETTEADKTLYLVHPQGWPRVDVVAIPIDPERPYTSIVHLSTGEDAVLSMSMRQKAGDIAPGFDIDCIQDFEQEVSKLNSDLINSLTVSDDLFILGYPQGIADWHGSPLWKRATVASAPHLGWNRQKQFLVDCASREGMSGAPAVSYYKNGRVQIGGMTYVGARPATIFHGIYVGRVGRVSEFEAQIGTIWQRSIVDEIIEGGVFGLHSSRIIATQDEVLSAIQHSWPATENYAAMILGSGDYSYYFTDTVMKSLNGRANPEDVRAQVLEFARCK